MDGATDGGATDAASDASPDTMVDASTPGAVLCGMGGMLTCRTPNVCCDMGGGISCKPEAECTGIIGRCDGDEDCVGDQRCCVNDALGGSACIDPREECATYACHVTADCSTSTEGIPGDEAPTPERQICCDDGTTIVSWCIVPEFCYF